MKITRKDIIRYRLLESCTWHDEAWHSEIENEKNSSIMRAEMDKEYGDGYPEIARKAEKHLAWYRNWMKEKQEVKTL